MEETIESLEAQRKALYQKLEQLGDFSSMRGYVIDWTPAQTVWYALDGGESQLRYYLKMLYP